MSGSTAGTATSSRLRESSTTAPRTTVIGAPGVATGTVGSVGLAVAAQAVAAEALAAEAVAVDAVAAVDDAAAFVEILRAGFARLGDPGYAAFQHRIAPGLGPSFGIGRSAQTAFRRALRRGLGRGRTRADTTLRLCDRLLRQPEAELRWLAIDLLDGLVAVEPERSWQLLRDISRGAGEWITVDSLAHPYGRGILLEPYRWAELEQLTFAPSRWERRLVGSTIATIPFIDRRAGREAAVARHGLGLVDDLIGDADADVQKALAWALRSLTRVDPTEVEAFCLRQADRAVETGDGARAWVVRDALSKLRPPVALDLRTRLARIRRRADAPSTSRAAAIAARFDDLIAPSSLAAPSITPPASVAPRAETSRRRGPTQAPTGQES